VIAWIRLAPLFGALINGILFASGLSRRFLGGSEHEEKRIVGIIGCGVVLISALISYFLSLRRFTHNKKRLYRNFISGFLRVILRLDLSFFLILFLAL